MTDAPDHNLYLNYFSLYQSEMLKIQGPRRLAEFDWHKLPDKLSMAWFAYNLLLPDFALSISNTINALGNYAHRIMAWDHVLRNASEDDKLALIFEFVDPIVVLATNLPQVIKSRFAFSAAHLSHQANKILDKEQWKDDLPDDGDIGIKTAHKYGYRWTSYGKFRVSLEHIYSGEHIDRMDNFRNKYNHRFPPQEAAGHTGYVKRQIIMTDKSRRVQYNFGVLPPFDLNRLGKELMSEFERALVVLDCFQFLIKEQISAIEISDKSYFAGQ